MKSISLERFLFERVDLEKINAIRQTFQEIKTAILALPATPAAFKKNGWKMEEGKLKTLIVSSLYAETAFDNLILLFESGITQEAWASENDGTLLLGFRIPRVPETVKTKAQYNLWFVEEVKKWFQKPYSESLFIHEFIHLLDMSRIGVETFFKKTGSAQPLEDVLDSLTDEVRKIRASLKDIPKGTPERDQAIRLLNKTTAKLKVATERFWRAYQNSPIESNAFFNQAVATVKEKAFRALRERGKLAALSVLGNSPQEFVAAFEKELPALVRVDLLDPKVLKGFRKRAAILYDQLVDEIESGKERSLV